MQRVTVTVALGIADATRLDALQEPNESNPETLKRALRDAYNGMLLRLGGLRTEALSESFWTRQRASYTLRTGRGVMDAD